MVGESIFKCLDESFSESFCRISFNIDALLKMHRICAFSYRVLSFGMEYMYFLCRMLYLGAEHMHFDAGFYSLAQNRCMLMYGFTA